MAQVKAKITRSKNKKNRHPKFYMFEVQIKCSKCLNPVKRIDTLREAQQ